MQVSPYSDAAAQQRISEKNLNAYSEKKATLLYTRPAIEAIHLWPGCWSIVVPKSTYSAEPTTKRRLHFTTPQEMAITR